MPTFRCHAEIAAPRAALFDWTQDYDLRPQWDPSHGAAEHLEGGRVRYRTRDGAEMVVRYVSKQSPERVAMTMLEGPWMFRRFSGSWVFEELGPALTRVTFAYHFELRGLLALASGFVRRRLERTMEARLAGLKAWAESAHHDGK